MKVKTKRKKTCKKVTPIDHRSNWELNNAVAKMAGYRPQWERIAYPFGREEQ
jgi:hypothetical protein